MALKRTHFNGVADNTAIAAGATPTSLGDAGSVAVAGIGTGTVKTDCAIRGLRGVQLSCPTAGTDYFQFQLTNTAASSGSAQMYFNVDSTRSPGTASNTLHQMRNSGGNAMKMVLGTDRKLMVQNAAGSTINTMNGGSALPDGDYYFNTRVTKGTTTANGTIKADLYKAVDDTRVGAAYSSTVVNAGTTDLTTAQFGKLGGAGSYSGWMDDVAFDTGITTEIPAVSNQLTDPVVTAGTTTDPSTIGGTNGSQVVSWAAVPNATSYKAYSAVGAAPDQVDFTLKASGVTSPYTFTGLSAGTTSFGIKAIA